MSPDTPNFVDEIRYGSADMERVAARTIVPDVTLMRGNHDAQYDYAREVFVHQLSGFFLAGAPRPVTVSVRVPYSWWDHFKRDVWLPLLAWVAALRPSWLWAWADLFASRTEVRLRTVSHTEDVNRNVCPHAPLGEVRDEQRHLEFLMRGDDPSHAA